MKIIEAFFLTLLVSFPIENKAQSTKWDSIKANYEPFVALTNEYGTPYIQNLNNLGWEDGLHMSRDGLHLYAFYSPLDLISFITYVESTNDTCYNYQTYLRGPYMGMDTICPWINCSGWIHSDIIYASRSNINSPFSSWTLSNLATPCTYEGAPNFIMKNNDTIDIFVFDRNNYTTGDDVMIMRNVIHNPNDIATILPAPLNTSMDDSNPDITRLNDSTFVLLEGIDGIDLTWSMSYDDGLTWSNPQTINSLWNGHVLHPHIWYENQNWWIYFADNIPATGQGIYRAKKTTTDLNNWDDWGTKELVIGKGEVNGGYGLAIAIGEPTLTQWGDISFVALYADSASTDSTDVYDIDPWFLPRYGSPLSNAILKKSASKWKLYPNPTTHSTTLKFDNHKKEKNTLTLYNIKGQIVRTITNITNDKVIIKKNSLPDGLFFFHLINEKQKTITGKLILE